MSDDSPVDIGQEINDVLDRMKPILVAVADGFQPFSDIGVFTENVPRLIDELIDLFVKASAEYSEIRENVQALQEIWAQRPSASR